MTDVSNSWNGQAARYTSNGLTGKGENDMKKAAGAIGFILMMIGAGSMDSDVLVIPYIMLILGCVGLFYAGRGLNDTL